MVICLTTAVLITLVNFAQMLLDTKFETSALNDPKRPRKLQINPTPYMYTSSPKFRDTDSRF